MNSCSVLRFLPRGAKEVRAWTVLRGATASEAAVVIHSDFERGFIRAEIMKFSALERLGTEQAVRESGLLYIVGKDYCIQDGDIVHFRFNV